MIIFDRRQKNMRKKYFIMIGLMAGAVVFMSNRGGSPGGRTGSSTDGGTCATNGGCHANGNAPIASDMLSINTPAAGYSPDSTYQITLTAAYDSREVYGFEMMAEDASGNGTGAFQTTTGVNPQGVRATHTFNSSGGQGSKTWEINWKAPAKGTGDLKLYVAVIAANGNFANTGDVCLIDTLDIMENEKAAIGRISSVDMTVFPNPAVDRIELKGYQDLHEYEIIDMQGRKVLEGQVEASIDVSSLPSGHYTLIAFNDEARSSTNFIKR